MKEEINIPVLKEEDFVAATVRRDNYALKRDLQAQEFNSAIVARMVADEKNQIKCDKCGKVFDAGITKEETLTCPACK